MNDAPLRITGLSKKYPAFELRGVSFEVGRGRICGFVGRNGAGKTTTLRSLFDIVHPDSGNIEFFGGIPLGEAKERCGFVSGGADYYSMKRLAQIASVVRGFYPNWDEGAYRHYLSEFELDESKTIKQLSAGMRVKFALALALSHNAELLILDEPTSGLDPYSRAELVDIFNALAKKGVSILFSTHITSDLERSCDDIVYIRRGEMIFSGTLDDFSSAWRIVEFDEGDDIDSSLLVGKKDAKAGYTALIRREDAGAIPQALIREAQLDEIMIHLEGGEVE